MLKKLCSIVSVGLVAVTFGVNDTKAASTTVKLESQIGVAVGLVTKSTIYLGRANVDTTHPTDYKLHVKNTSSVDPGWTNTGFTNLVGGHAGELTLTGSSSTQVKVKVTNGNDTPLQADGSEIIGSKIEYDIDAKAVSADSVSQKAIDSTSANGPNGTDVNIGTSGQRPITIGAQITIPNGKKLEINNKTLTAKDPLTIAVDYVI